MAKKKKEGEKEEKKDPFEEMENLDGFSLMPAEFLRAWIRLKIPDLLFKEPLTLERLVQKMGANKENLFRFMRAAQTLGYVTKTGNGEYDFTEKGKKYSDHNPFMNQLRLYAEWSLRYQDLVDAVQSGKTTLDDKYQGNYFNFLKTKPELVSGFDSLMSGFAEWIDPKVLDAYDFSPFKHAVDVGGGNGELLFSILKKNPTLQGTVFDIEHVVNDQEYAPYKNRCQVEIGNFFKRVPSGGDVYILKQILHDWLDKESSDILRCLRKSVTVGTTLLIAEEIMPENDVDYRLMVQDLTLMVVFGSKERTLKEYEILLIGSGFKINRQIPVSYQYHLIEAKAV